MLLAHLVQVSATVAGTRSRLAKTAAVADALIAARQDEIDVVASYLAGRLPQRRTGVGWRGLAELPEPASSPTLTVAAVDSVMRDLEGQSGAGSAGRRRELIHQLFAAATEAEQQYLRSLMTGELRQGATDGVLQAAISSAAGVDEAVVRRAVMFAGFAEPVARIALTQGSAGVARVGLEPGRPLRPMLAGSAPEVAAAMGEQAATWVLERKLDGIRLQIHKIGDRVRLFTRSLDDITDRLPEVVGLARSLPVRTVVLDAEAIALAPDGRPYPFQVTGARTASRTATTSAPQVSTFCFDLLHVDGTDYTDLPLHQRFAALTRVVPERALVDRIVTDDREAATRFFHEQVAAGHEGVVVKDPDAPYAAGRRGSGWVKVKPRHTLDLVVLAVEWGSGRRRGKLSNIHLGARDDRSSAASDGFPESNKTPQSDGAPESDAAPASSGGFVMLGKTFKGMTDEMLDWQTERFLALATHREGHVVQVRAEQVVEIAFDGLQRSTRYPGGVALRFARVLRYRDDKTAADADSLSAVLSSAAFSG
ncbi:MAG: ATP-dependent DNA ligase [Actinomycetales bacterium]